VVYIRASTYLAAAEPLQDQSLHEIEQRIERSSRYSADRSSSYPWGPLLHQCCAPWSRLSNSGDGASRPNPNDSARETPQAKPSAPVRDLQAHGNVLSGSISAPDDSRASLVDHPALFVGFGEFPRQHQPLLLSKYRGKILERRKQLNSANDPWEVALLLILPEMTKDFAILPQKELRLRRPWLSRRSPAEPLPGTVRDMPRKAVTKLIR
jgi:hypothetical protein